MFKNYIAEFLGTFLIVLFGCGAIVVNQQYPNSVTHFGISLTFGLIVCVAIIVFKNHSTHFNPAVSITFFANKQLSFKHLIIYVCAQILGAITASALLKFVFPTNQALGSTSPSGTAMQSFVLEFILTFLLLMLIFILNKHQTKFAPILLGVLIFLEAYFAGPYCGASMNPARSIGPAIVSGQLHYLWIYILAPICGGLSSLLFVKKLNNQFF